MDCVFIRHGIAVEPAEWNGLETHRPLTDKGKKRVKQAAAGLASVNLAPTHILSSPFTRAKETASIIRAVLGPTLTIEIIEELAVGSTPERLLTRLRAHRSDSVVICVGHEPLLGSTVSLLLCGHRGEGFPMKKSAAALIHVPGQVGPGLGQLCWWIQPGQLRMLGKGRVKQGRTAKEQSDD
jgi:phosphohistidine phosphatase